MDVTTYSEQDVERYLRHIGYPEYNARKWKDEQKLIRHLAALQRHNVVKYIAVTDYLLWNKLEKDDVTTNRLFLIIGRKVYDYIERKGKKKIYFKNPKTQVVRFITQVPDGRDVNIFWQENNDYWIRNYLSFPQIIPTVVKWMEEGFRFYAGEQTFISACIGCPNGAMMAVCSGCNVSVYCGQECQKKDWQKHCCTKRV